MSAASLCEHLELDSAELRRVAEAVMAQRGGELGDRALGALLLDLGMRLMIAADGDLRTREAIARLDQIILSGRYAQVGALDTGGPH